MFALTKDIFWYFECFTILCLLLYIYRLHGLTFKLQNTYTLPIPIFDKKKQKIWFWQISHFFRKSPMEFVKKYLLQRFSEENSKGNCACRGRCL